MQLQVALLVALVLDLCRCWVMPCCRVMRGSEGSLREATEGPPPPGATQPLGQGQGASAVVIFCRGQVLYWQCVVNVLPVYY